MSIGPATVRHQTTVDQVLVGIVREGEQDLHLGVPEEHVRDLGKHFVMAARLEELHEVEVVDDVTGVKPDAEVIVVGVN